MKIILSDEELKQALVDFLERRNYTGVSVKVTAALIECTVDLPDEVVEDNQ